MYELLEVPQHASTSDIVRAYELAKRTYGAESLATYSLFNPAERQSVLARIEEAYRILSDPRRRHEYDAWLTAQGSLPLDQASGASPNPLPSELSNDAPVVAAGALSIPDTLKGPDLRQLRERRGVSLETIADKTRINITYLQHLEGDRLEKLPSPVFVRSYLIEYAKVLKLDADRVYKSYLKGAGVALKTD